TKNTSRTDSPPKDCKLRCLTQRHGYRICRCAPPLCMPVVTGGASVSGPETFVEGRREIRRQASIALGGRPVTVWEVSARAELEPHASRVPAPGHHDSTLDVDSTLRRWGIQIVQGSRFVGSRAPEGYWVVAPVRTRPPSPPPEGRERRSRERLTLELAGLCLGLLDRRELPTVPVPKRTDPLQDLATLPGLIAHEASNPLTAARAGLQLAMEALGRWTEVAAARRLEMLDELGQVVDDIDRGVNFLRAIKDRARGTLARSERFDAVRVVRSCCTLESRVLKDKKVPLQFDFTLEEGFLKGDPNAPYDMRVNLIRNAADASIGRGAPIRIGLEQTGGSLRLTVRDEGAGIRAEALERIFEPGFTTKEFGEGSGMGLGVVQSVVRHMFGGSIAVDSRPAGGPTPTVDSSGAGVLIDQALTRSQAMANLQHLTDVIGPRLTGSPAARAANDWTLAKFKEYGLDTHLEQWNFGGTWTRGPMWMRLTAPRPHDIVAASWAWAPGTNGKTVSGPVVRLDASTAESLEANKARVKGAWVMLRPPQFIWNNDGPTMTAADSERQRA